MLKKKKTLIPHLLLKMGNKPPMWRCPPYSKRIGSIFVNKVSKFNSKKTVQKSLSLLHFVILQCVTLLLLQSQSLCFVKSSQIIFLV